MPPFRFLFTGLDAEGRYSGARAPRPAWGPKANTGVSGLETPPTGDGLKSHGRVGRRAPPCRKAVRDRQGATPLTLPGREKAIECRHQSVALGQVQHGGEIARLLDVEPSTDRHDGRDAARRGSCLGWRESFSSWKKATLGPGQSLRSAPLLPRAYTMAGANVDTAVLAGDDVQYRFRRRPSQMSGRIHKESAITEIAA
jgi:hypothetical protein